MKISLILSLSDGTQQVHSYTLSEGLTLSGYTVDVDNGAPVAAPVVKTPTEKILPSSTYGKTGTGKAFQSAAALAAYYCGCNDPSRHRGGLDRGRFPDPYSFLFTPRRTP